MSDSASQDSSFIYVSCQAGAEAALKAEMTRLGPEFRLSFSRPGFVTFKLAQSGSLRDDFELRSIFARSYGRALGKIGAASPREAASAVWKRWQTLTTADESAWKIAVWPRDAFAPRSARKTAESIAAEGTPQAVGSPWGAEAQPSSDGTALQMQASEEAHASVEVGADDLARRAVREAQQALRETAPNGQRERSGPGPSSSSSKVSGGGRVTLREPSHSIEIVGPGARLSPGDRVLDVILVSPQEWWLGSRRQGSGHLPWAGGLSDLTLPEHAVSRAYSKMAEALAWSKLPIQAGQVAAELGCSPGGASQVLLEAGLRVVGVDPAEPHPTVRDHPQFTHFRKRSHEVRRKEFRKVRWLFADMNVAPAYTLDAVEGIVLSPESQVRGLLLTLKLPDWRLADHAEEFLQRIRDWGFSGVLARQLSQHRQEFAVAATRR